MTVMCERESGAKQVEGKKGLRQKEKRISKGAERQTVGRKEEAEVGSQ